MFDFEANDILGADCFTRVNENQETETLFRENYTIDELKTMNFIGKEQPLIKKDGVVIIRDGTVVRRYNAKTRSWEFMFIPRYPEFGRKEKR